MTISNSNIKYFVTKKTINKENFFNIKLIEKWTSVILDIEDMKTKQQHYDIFNVSINFKDTLLDSTSPDSSTASENKYPSDFRLLFNNTLPQSKCIDSNSVQFVTELQNNEYPLSVFVQEIQDIDPSVVVDSDDRQFLIERLVRKHVRCKRVQYLIK